MRQILSGDQRLLTWVVFPSYFVRTEAKLTWGIIFFSTESWNRGGGGKSTERKRNGDIVVLMSKRYHLVHRQPRVTGTYRDQYRTVGDDSCLPRGVQQPVVFPYALLLGMSRRLRLFVMGVIICAAVDRQDQVDILELRFLVPPRSLCRRLSNHPRNSAGSPCSWSLNFPPLARPTSWRNSWGLTWLLNNRGFQSFFARPANRFRSSLSLPLKSESRRKSRKGGMCVNAWMMTFIWSWRFMLLSPI